MRRLAGGLLIGAGLALSIVAAVIYSDLLGATDSIFIDDGLLSFRFSRTGRVVRTAIPTRDIYATLQHARPFVALAAGVFVVVGAVGARRRALHVIRSWPRGAQGVVALMLLAAALVSLLPVGDQGGALAIYFVLGSLGFGLVFWGLWRFGGDVAADHQLAWWCRFVSGEDPAPRRLIGWLTAAVLLGACAVSLAVFAGLPHVVDGVSHLFQARILASGQLALTSHALREFFDLETVVNNGRWFSQYTPGHALLLIFGDTLGAPWLVNPLLGAATVPALYALGTETHGRGTAVVAALLLVTSPFFILMSSEYYSHASVLLFLTLFLHQYVRFVSTGERRYALAGGVWLGLALLSRPLTAFAVAIPCAVHAVVIASRQPNIRRFSRIGLMAVVTLGFAGLLLLYNLGTTGALFTFGYAEAIGLGFGPRDESGGLRALGRVIALNNDMLGWPIPALLLPTVVFLARRPSHWDYLLASVFFSLLAFYAPWGYPDREFGPRYLYEAIGPLLLLSARGLAVLHESVARFVEVTPHVKRIRSGVGVGLATCLLIACAFSWPPRLGFYGSTSWRWAYPHDAVAVVRAANLENAVVFVRGNRLWAALFLDNDLPLTDTASVIYAQDRGADNRRLVDYYPNRRYFVADATGLTPLLP